MSRLQCLLLCLIVAAVKPLAFAGSDVETYRQWVADMKRSPRGPFERIRWFCADGSILPPKAYACVDHGGGVQHGELSAHARELRENGYFVVNLLAGVDAEEFLGEPDVRERYAQLLVEKFLVGVDNGWIFREALFYRGAIQEEDEREGARELLGHMAVDPWWSGPGFPAWRIGARLLAHGRDSASIDRVRQFSAGLSDSDPGFRELRAKIHGSPDAQDAERVRAYARTLDDAQRAKPYVELARQIDAVYAPRPLAATLEEFLQRSPPAALDAAIRPAREELGRASSSLESLQVTGKLLAALRDAQPQIGQASWKLAALDLGLQVENAFFVEAARLRQSLSEMSRAQHLSVLVAAGQAAHGAGLINVRLHAALQDALGELARASVALEDYQRVLAYLRRVPGWGTQALRMHFFEAMQTLAELEPVAMRFVQDQLRGSPLLLFSDALDALSADAGQLAGIRHRFFGEDPGGVFTALNPGVARGILHVAPDLSEVENFRADGIYVLPETVSDLPPVRGILTAGEGNPLSHVQLLARNLGIPNATVDERFLQALKAHDGEQVVLAVSSAGLVELAADGPRWQAVFDDEGSTGGALIAPDVAKLELSVADFLPLDGLRADASGRTVGPKAAKLGELRHRYPEAVGNGVAIPFGAFKAVALEQPHPDGGTVREWMLASYRELGPIDETDTEQARRYDAFRAELYDLVRHAPVDDAFMRRLENALEAAFGTDHVPGLFVRSDTNVEDLAGFTGAGLNLTLPNVQGIDALRDSIKRVWASPFAARAFAWRQSHMTSPEHVYTSILLLESQPSDKSGVLVTRDIDTGSPQWLSVAVNEGVGGAVDGQAAESLRIRRSDGRVRVLATATAPWRRMPDPEGGLMRLPSSGADTLLDEAEIEQLIAFADSLPERFPPIVDDAGKPTAADVEFGFIDGKLRLFQLRPFLESRETRGADYLAAMDASLAANADLAVDMKERPAR